MTSAFTRLMGQHVMAVLPTAGDILVAFFSLAGTACVMCSPVSPLISFFLDGILMFSRPNFIFVNTNNPGASNDEYHTDMGSRFRSCAAGTVVEGPACPCAGGTAVEGPGASLSFAIVSSN